MKHKVSELEGPLLDAAVAMAEGRAYRLDKGWCEALLPGYELLHAPFSPSAEWAHGGPIIEREQISITSLSSGGWWADAMRCHRTEPHDEGSHCTRGIGPTPLIAAMRAFVASKLGEEVELPG